MATQDIAAPDMQPAPDPADHMPRLPVLDGWRGLSIVLILACHIIVPLGLAGWDINLTVGLIGMAIFFTLSGFLIVRSLYQDSSVRNFAIRRLARILPIAWLFLILTLPFLHANRAMWQANLLFYSNRPPFYFTETTGHFWSLCVEVQFYLAIGLTFAVLRRRAFLLLPIACLAVTAYRIVHHQTYNIETRFRIDEILSGATLAWLFHGKHSAWLKRALTWLNPIVPVVLLCLSGHPAFPALNYARPYIAALSVGTTLYHPRSFWSRFFESRTLAYLATLSYALYVWQPLSTHPPYWPTSVFSTYVSTELGLPITFFVAYCSTHYYERFWINLGKRFLIRNRTA
jgi:peptidoglycan/LPS O-acetylase OafA/YrhL